MELEVVLSSLIELGKKNQGFVYSSDVLKYCNEDSDDYDTIEAKLLENEIDILPDEEPSDDLTLTEIGEPNLLDVEELDYNGYEHFLSRLGFYINGGPYCGI